MARWFNIGGPCRAAKNYMLPAVDRLPEVMSLINKEQYFVVHAPRQCGKTTAFQALVDEINTKGEMVAMYCSVEALQMFTDPKEYISEIVQQLRFNLSVYPQIFTKADDEALGVIAKESTDTTVVANALKWLSERVKKPFVIFFDEVDCLSDDMLVSFLRQLRNGRIACSQPGTFPVSMALIGLRNIRDYKMRIRPDSHSTGEASPFNVITKAMTLRSFTEAELRALYKQHTDETGQVFEEEALVRAYDYSRGQPYLVNALARWCVEEIHHEDYSLPITGEDMHVAKEKIIRERGTHLDSLMEKVYDPRIKPLVEKILTGGEIDRENHLEDIAYALDLGIFVDNHGVLEPANPIYRETIGRYMTRGTQDTILAKTPDAPWVRDNGLDMAGLLATFQEFWRENATPNAFLAQYHEAYPHLVLQAFFQRVVNGGGEIIREMALGKGALDLGVKFRGATYPVEVKLDYLYRKSPEKAYDQVCRYIDHLGEKEGWLVIFDPDLSKPWEEKVGHEDLERDGKVIHVVRC